MKDDRIKHILATWDAIEDGDLDISTERLMETTKHVAKCSHDELMTALQTIAQKPTQ
jgi:hypothetical protein